MVFGARPHCAPSQKLHPGKDQMRKIPVDNFAQQVINGPSLLCVGAKPPDFCRPCLPPGALKQGAFAICPVQNSGTGNLSGGKSIFPPNESAWNSCCEKESGGEQQD